ncbi:MAG: alpha/beta fold hydrolase, partial [Oligoflexus sp.]
MRYFTCSWQAYVALMTSTLLFTSCRSTQSSSKFLGEVGLQTGFPPETTRLWEDYQTKAAAGGFEYQPDCAPKSIAAKGSSKGLVIIYHGFTGCPNQFGNVAAELSDLGFDVLLPTLPGNGRKPINQAFLDANSAPSARQKIIEDVRNNRQSNVIQDDISGIPFKTVDYFSYAEEMTKIAKSYPGPRILIGLSLGGGLATATLVKGADLKDPGEVNVWSRSLLITPFFKAPSIQGVAADVTGSVAPNFKAGFGNDCEAGQLEVGYRFRNGICDFTGGQIDTLQNLGKEVSAKEQMSKIQIPIQIIGVANDNTSDNTAVIKAFGFTSPNL